MDKGLKKDIFIYYLSSFLLGFYIANGTTVLFARQLGLSFSRIFILGAVYMLMFIIFEMPTGAFADLVGRKKAMIIGYLALTVAALASGLSNNFTQLFLSFFVWSLGFCLISGSGEAMVYDRIQDERLYSQAAGKSHFYNLIGFAAAGVVGPWLYNINFRFSYLFSAIPFFLGAVVLFWFKEPSFAGKFTIQNQINQLKVGFKMAFENRFVLWAMGMLALTFAVWYTFSNAFQPYLEDIGFSVKMFSVILPIMAVVQAFGGRASEKFYSKLGENMTFTFSVILIGVMLALMGFVNLKISLVFLFAYCFLQGVLRPTISIYSNRYIVSSHRATVISVQSMVATLLAALMLFGFGFLTDRIGLNNLLLVMGAVVVILGLMLTILKPKEKKVVA
jgi:MFS family permease